MCCNRIWWVNNNDTVGTRTYLPDSVCVSAENRYVVIILLYTLHLDVANATKKKRDGEEGLGMRGDKGRSTTALRYLSIRKYEKN